MTGLSILRDRTRLRELFEGFWAALPEVEIDPAMLASRRAQVEEFRRELAGLASFEALTGSGFIQRYRELKHEMGRYLFQPELMIAVVETNLAVKNKVRQYYHPEEQRVASTSRSSFSTSRNGVPTDAAGSSARSPSCARRSSSFERKQQRDNVKLGGSSTSCAARSRRCCPGCGARGSAGERRFAGGARAVARTTVSRAR